MSVLGFTARAVNPKICRMRQIYDETMPFGPRFSIPSKTFRRRLDERMKSFDLTAAQSAALMAINRLRDEGYETVSQSDIEKITRGTHATLTEVLRKLERRGFITMAQNPGDKRSKIIKSTPKAEEVYAEIQKCDAEIFRQLSEGIPEDEKTAFLSTLWKIIDNCHSSDCAGRGKGDTNDKETA